MQSDLAKLIEAERARIVALDASLKSGRTPYMKGQLRSALHALDDAMDGLQHAAKAPREANMWMGFASMNFQHAGQIRDKVQAAVETYGGPENVIEMGG